MPSLNIYLFTSPLSGLCHCPVCMLRRVARFAWFIAFRWVSCREISFAWYFFLWVGLSATKEVVGPGGLCKLFLVLTGPFTGPTKRSAQLSAAIDYTAHVTQRALVSATALTPINGITRKERKPLKAYLTPYGLTVRLGLKSGLSAGRLFEPFLVCTSSINSLLNYR